MKKLLLLLFFIAFVVINSNAQDSLANSGFEDWTSLGTFDEPGGPWATANKASLIGLKATTFKTDDKYSGSWAAKMVTDTAIMSSIPILLTGTLATGVFQPNPTNPLNSLRIGTPFTARPEKFTGYYKYTSVNNDSFDIYAILSEWDTINNERTIIGTAMFTDSLTVSSYTKFDLDFQYYKSFTPDTISVVFASSAAGDLFLGSVGSTLFIDEIALELPVGIKIPLMPEINIIAYPNPASDQIIFKTDKVLTNGRLFIYNSEGKEIHALNFLNNITTIDLAGFNKGIYYYQLLDGNSLMNAGDFIVK